MPLDGSPILGENLVVSVEDPATPGAFLEIGNMNRYSKTSNRTSRATRVFHKTVPVRSISKTRDQTLTISGLESPGDPGQDALNAAEAAGTEVNLKLLVDGVNGFTQHALVTSYKNDASADDGELRDISYDFAFTDVAVAIVGGYTLL